MRARAAYIRSLGTTSILVAAALMMLGVVGALVGFHGWPEGAVGETVPSVPLKPTPELVPSVVRDVRQAAIGGATDAATQSGTTTAGLVKVRSPQAVGYPEAVPPGEAGPTSGAPASQAPAAAQHDPGSPAPIQAPGAPADPQGLQTLLDQLGGSAPPPPGGAPQEGQAIDVTVPIVGVTVSVPPGTSQ